MERQNIRVNILLATHVWEPQPTDRWGLSGAMGTNPWEGVGQEHELKTKQLATRKTAMTPPASHQMKACKKNSLLEFITSLKVRNATTAVDAKNSSLHRLFGSMVLASR